MVSVRRRRLLGLCTGTSACVTPDPKCSDDEAGTDGQIQTSKLLSADSLPSEGGGGNQLQEESIDTTVQGSSDVSGRSSLKDQQSLTQSISDRPVKHRKRHRRKQSQSQEPCLMRGVYFKNRKWQAAIKVEKKQIHLGTCSSQEEAGHLYDRAAFMCGREPNSELPEEEKQELSRLSWDQFLAMTRQSINDKKQKRRLVLRSQVPSSRQEAIPAVSGSSVSEKLEQVLPSC